MSNQIRERIVAALRQYLGLDKPIPSDQPPLHYFDLDEADPKDGLLRMAKDQGYVPKTCLLGGMIVMGMIQSQRDPCAGCAGPREKCDGRPKADGN